MIINSQNKDAVLKGTLNRGFNQPPKELKEKLYNQLHASTQNKEVQNPKIEPKPDSLKYKNAYNNLNRLNKKL